MGPTPRRRHDQAHPLVLARLLSHTLFKAVQLAQQDLMRCQQGLADDLQRRMARDQLFDPKAEAVRGRSPNLQAKAAQYAAQAHFNVKQLRLNQFARRQQRAHFLRRHRLAVNRAEPAQPHQLRNPARVVAVALDRHRLEGVMHVPRLQQFHRQAFFLHCRIKPLRQRPGLQPNARQFKSKIPEPANQVFRFAENFRLPNDLAARIHDANTGGFQ